MSTTSMPALFTGFVDDAAVFPPGNLPVAEAVVAHRQHRTAWYRDFVGPLLLPTESAAEAAEPATAEPATAEPATAEPAAAQAFAAEQRPTLGLIGEVERLRVALAEGSFAVRQVESAVAKRGEDPAPGVAALIELAGAHPDIDVYAEIPLTWGLLAALDRLALARADGVRIAPKFRTGGLAAELFPTPVELAAVICACRDRALPFKLTAGLHRAIRHNEPDTGFTHHGFLNVLAATLTAVSGAEVAAVADLLATTDPIPLIETVRPCRSEPRPLWTGFGSCSVREPLDDLIGLRLIAEVAA